MNQLIEHTKHAATKGWVIPAARVGARPMRVATLLRKDMDGSLYQKANLLKAAALAGAGVPAEYGVGSEPETNPRWFPTRADQSMGGMKRQDGRGNAVTDFAPGLVLGEPGTDAFNKNAYVCSPWAQIQSSVGYVFPPSALAAEKVAFQTSEFSGPLSYGRFPMVSSQPGFRAPNIRAKPFQNRPQQIHTGNMKLGALLSPTAVGSPKSQLGSSMKIGRPRFTAPSGPSVHQIAKPKGFGSPIPGSKKSVI